jgi:hypothetical protein
MECNCVGNLPVIHPLEEFSLIPRCPSSKIFQTIGFKLQTSDTPDDVLRLIPPVMSISTEEGRRNRARILRVWIEISAWVSLYTSSKGKSAINLDSSLDLIYITGVASLVRDRTPPAHKLWVRVVGAREDYQRMIGAHPDQSKFFVPLSAQVTDGEIIARSSASRF